MAVDQQTEGESARGAVNHGRECGSDTHAHERKHTQSPALTVHRQIMCEGGEDLPAAPADKIELFLHEKFRNRFLKL